MRPSIRIVVLAGAAALLAGCVTDEKLVNPPPAVTTPLLARYVSMGNSITAGMQSAGINDSLQRRAYPVLLARMAGVPFVYPSFPGTGCPAPYVAPLGQGGTLGGSAAPACTFRQLSTALPNNVAVPGEFVADITNTATPGAAANVPLSTFILGGLTEAQLMTAERPTFVSFWAPNNDVLGGATVGDVTRMTSLSSYQASLNAAVAAIKTANPQGAVLIGVVDVPRFAPLLQPGAYFYAAYTANPLQFGGKVVDAATCNPTAPTSRNLVSFRVVADTSVATRVISCADNAPYVLNQSEIVSTETLIAGINAAVKTAADGAGWLYVDPNAEFAAALADTTGNVLRKCQLLATATLATFQSAVVKTCPGGSQTAPFFGSLVSFDGVHPSTSFHQQFASILAQKINAKYQTSISTTAPTTF